MKRFTVVADYPPSYKRLVWHYQQVNTDMIEAAIDLFDWDKSFSYLDVNKQVSVFNETIMNIFGKKIIS